ncbi:MAG: alpha/beta hydrolase [Bacteroidota bacterium]
MRKVIFLFVVLITTYCTVFASNQNDTTFNEEQIILKTESGDIFGTLLLPEKRDNIPIAIIIAGSGPTDRNGNNPSMKNDCLKKLANELSFHNIASLRYDKRGIAESKVSGKKEIDLRFDDYVDDVIGWLKLFKHDKRFTKVIIIGHSEGSLIGMVASAIEPPNMFISIAGAGKSADLLLKEQLKSQPKEIIDISFPIIDSLKLGITYENVNPILFSLFRPSVQPYMISWFKYDPQIEISKLNIPVLIIQGTNDIQISTEDATLLSKSNQNSQLVQIDSMNHIFRIVENDMLINVSTYNNETLPISKELVKSIVDFVLN